MQGNLSSDAMKKLVDASGAGLFDSKVSEFKFSGDELMGGDAVDRFRKIGLERVRQLRTDVVRMRDPEYRGGWGGPDKLTEVPTTDVNRLEAAGSLEKAIMQQVALAQKQLDEIKRLGEQSKRQAEAAEETNRKTPAARPASGANLHTERGL